MGLWGWTLWPTARAVKDSLGLFKGPKYARVKAAITQVNPMKNAFNTQRRNMIDGQIKPFSVVEEGVLAAFDAVARESFVPDAWKKRAYAEADIPFSNNRFLVESALFARLIQDAGVTKHAAAGTDVLDVGCLWGYSSAVLARFGGNITACDTDAFVAEAVRRARKADKINFIAADMGAVPQNKANKSGQYDFVVINGAVDIIPDTWADIVRPGGRVAAFSTRGHAVVFEKHGDILHERVLFDARVPALAGFDKKREFTL